MDNTVDNENNFTENDIALITQPTKKKRRWLRRLITFLIIIVVIGGGYYVATTILFPPKQQTVQDAYSLAEVTRGTLEVKVQGTGNISSANSYDIISSQPGKVEQLNFDVGDIVEEGALLYEISNKDLEDAIDRARNDLKQTQINTEKQKNTLTNYYIDAPASGIIKNLKARTGEDAATTSKAFGALCYISTEGKMRATITPTTKTTYVIGPTNAPVSTLAPTGTPTSAPVYTNSPLDNVIEISVGDWIYLLINSQTHFARVTSASQGSLVCEIQSDAFEIGAKVEAYEYDVWGQKIGEGKLELVDPVAVTGSGIITGISVSEGQYVARGQRMFDIDTRDVDLSLQSQSLTRQQTQQQIEEDTEKLNDNQVFIPHSGVISQLNVKIGQNVTGGMVVGTIVDFRDQEITLDVDELDIPKIIVGQATDIRVDALEGEEFSGVVKKIGELGTTSGGLTTYPVTISLVYDAKIRIGMSASADILVDKHENTLIVPLEVINEGEEKFVLVLAGGRASAGLPLPAVNMPTGGRNQSQGSAGAGNAGQGGERPSGAGQGGERPGTQTQMRQAAPNGNGQATAVIERRVVTVGLTNESYAEILDGLKEGDIVLVPKSANSALANMQAMMFGSSGGGARPQQAQPVQRTSGGGTQVRQGG